jgi:hypothetical protein
MTALSRGRLIKGTARFWRSLVGRRHARALPGGEPDTGLCFFFFYIPPSLDVIIGKRACSRIAEPNQSLPAHVLIVFVAVIHVFSR